MGENVIGPELEEELLSVCRTAVGDELRSITYFDEESVEQLYLRSDLDRTADLVGFAEHERMSFRSQSAYRNTSPPSAVQPDGRSRPAVRSSEYFSGALVARKWWVPPAPSK